MVWYWKSQSLVFFCVCEITVSLSERIILTRLDSLDSLKMMLAFFVSSPSRGMSAIKQHLEQKKVCVKNAVCESIKYFSPQTSQIHSKRTSRMFSAFFKTAHST